MFKLKTSLIIFILILTIGAILRISGFYSFSLTNDELSALLRVKYDSFSDLINLGVIATDPHPAGLQVFLYYWTKVFGVEAFWVRLPFVFMSILSIPVLYGISRSWFNEQSALFSTSVFAVLEFPIMYGQIARPYSAGLFFCLLTVYFWTKLINNERLSLKVSWAYVLFAAFCCYTHYFSGLFAFVVGITGIFLVARKQLIKYLLINLSVAVLFIPHIPITLHQLDVGGLSGWLPKPDSSFFMEHVLFIFNDSIILVLLVSMFLVYSLKTKVKDKANIYRIIALFWFSFPILLGYFYSLYFESVLMDRVLLFSFPFLLIFMFSWIRNLNKIVLFAPLLILSVGAYSTVYQNDFYKTPHFEDFELLAQKTKEWDLKYGEENINHTINLNSKYYIDYYLSRKNHETNFLIDQTIYNEEVKELMRIVDTSTSAYFSNGWACIHQPIAIEQIIRRKYAIIIERVQQFNTAITLYGRSSHDSNVNFSEEQGFEGLNPYWEYQNDNIDTSVYHSGNYSYQFEKNAEFGIKRTIGGEQLNGGNVDVLSVSAFIYAEEPITGKLVISIERGQETLSWHAVDLESFIDESDKWQEIFISAKLPGNLLNDDRVLIYFWNNNHHQFNVDDVHVYGSEKSPKTL